MSGAGASEHAHGPGFAIYDTERPYTPHSDPDPDSDSGCAIPHSALRIRIRIRIPHLTLKVF